MPGRTAAPALLGLHYDRKQRQKRASAEHRLELQPLPSSPLLSSLQVFTFVLPHLLSRPPPNSSPHSLRISIASSLSFSFDRQKFTWLPFFLFEFIYRVGAALPSPVHSAQPESPRYRSLFLPQLDANFFGNLSTVDDLIVLGLLKKIYCLPCCLNYNNNIPSVESLELVSVSTTVRTPPTYHYCI